MKPRKAAWDESRKRAILFKLAEFLGNVGEACRIMNCSRSTFYRLKSGPADADRRTGVRVGRNLSSDVLARKRALIERIIRAHAEHPHIGKRRLARIIQQEGTYVSPSHVYTILRFHRDGGPGFPGVPPGNKPVGAESGGIGAAAAEAAPAGREDVSRPKLSATIGNGHATLSG